MKYIAEDILKLHSHLLVVKKLIFTLKEDDQSHIHNISRTQSTISEKVWDAIMNNDSSKNYVTLEN